MSGAVKSYVKKTIAKNIETKTHNFTANQVAIPDGATGGVSNELIDIAQGDTENTRTGNAVKVTGLYGKFGLVTADTSNLVRVVIYIPKDADDALSTLTCYDLIDLDQYTILYDRYFQLYSGGPGGKAFTIAKKFKNGINIRWYGTGATDFAKNPLRMYLVSDSGAVSHPSYTGNMRTYFKDG